jgi:hypothetical protein
MLANASLPEAPARMSGNLTLSKLVSPAWANLCASVRRAWVIVAPALALDKPVTALLVLYTALWAPLISRQTANPRMLASYSNDEPLLTQELVAMRYRPYGNPANLDLANPKHGDPPAYWGTIRYWGACYYGGTFLGAAFLLYMPLKACQLHDFPLAPMVLRTVCVLGGIVSLLVVYNLGKRLSGWATGLLAALVLLTDWTLAYYSSIIHPDTTMLALSLLALWTAIRHAETGSRATLLLTGVFIGLTQGAKMGGPWLVPMATLATAWGVHTAPGSDAPRRVRTGRFIGRMGLLGLVAFGTWVLSTPYAFVDPFFFGTLRVAWRTYNQDSSAQATAWTWLIGVWDHEGAVILSMAGAGLALLPWRRWRGQQSALLVLSATLAVSIIAFHAWTVKLWVLVGYLLPGLALVGLLAADFLVRAVRGVSARSRLLGGVAALAGASCLAAALYPRVILVLAHALGLYCLDCSTPFYVNRWAQDNLSADARILHDDVAYFNPEQFPNARLHGGLLTYTTLEKENPDYFMLSGMIYESDYYVHLRKTQQYKRGQEGPLSVLLYQDLLDRDGCPEAELIATFRPAPPSARTGLDRVIRVARLAMGLDDYLFGPEIRLYRYRPPASAPIRRP